MKAGDTFLIPDFFGKHLNVVIAVLEDGSIIHCHLTTQNRRSDNTCVVESGEHEFVKHRTVVRYDAVQPFEAVLQHLLEYLAKEIDGSLAEKQRIKHWVCLRDVVPQLQQVHRRILVMRCLA